MTDEKKKWVVKPYGSMHAIYHESKPNSPLFQGSAEKLQPYVDGLNNLPERPKNEVKPPRERKLMR